MTERNDESRNVKIERERERKSPSLGLSPKGALEANRYGSFETPPNVKKSRAGSAKDISFSSK